MALQIPLDEEQSGIGVPAPEAYAKIVIYTHDIKNDAIQMAVEFHFNVQAMRRDRRPMKGAAYQLLGSELSGTGNFRSQLYEWLKARPEFDGSADV